MSAPPVNLDFIRRRAPLTVFSSVLLLLGLGAVAAAFLGYRQLESRRAGLELKLDALARRSQRDPTLDLRAAGLSEAAGRLAQELGTPWTRLLAELETASADSDGKISVLSIDPDHSKHSVHITGESRDLSLMLGYVQRLQASTLLRYPMLESHDVKTDDPQHPVRFAMTAEWRELP